MPRKMNALERSKAAGNILELPIGSKWHGVHSRINAAGALCNKPDEWWEELLTEMFGYKNPPGQVLNLFALSCPAHLIAPMREYKTWGHRPKKKRS